MYFDSLLPDSLDASFSTPDSSSVTTGRLILIVICVLMRADEVLL